MIRVVIAGCALGFAVGALPAAGAEEAAAGAVENAPLTIDELVESVRDRGEQQQALLAERERRFIEARDRRAAMLDDVRKQRLAAEAEADRLRAEFERAEELLADLETQRDERTGDLRDVFAVVHQVAGDVQPLIENSLVSAQHPGRVELPTRLANRDTLPTADDIRALWLLLLDEMSASGKTSRFEARVISPSGEEGDRLVTRIGTFNAFADGDYLRYLPETGRLLALSRQPTGTSPATTLAFEQSETKLATLPIDPSRGSILSLIVQRTDLLERIEQGGVIGYLIILIGVVGVGLGLERVVVTFLTQRRQRAELAGASDGGAVRQMRDAAASPDYRNSADALSAKLDEIVATAAQRLNRGLPTLAILAAVSPLLGLLGTVTGMIETFQVITLFGAGDPRLMSGGISQALITTQLGLSVAIPLLLIHSFAQGRANELTSVLDETAASLFAEERAKVANHAA